jgi:hypothetical protein
MWKEGLVQEEGKPIERTVLRLWCCGGGGKNERREERDLRGEFHGRRGDRG